MLEQAVLDGFRQWEGEYTVFGGQKLAVKIELTTEDRIFDSTVVVPVGDEFRSVFLKTSQFLKSKEKKESFSSIASDKRSFATIGMNKWSVSSRKLIFSNARIVELLIMKKQCTLLSTSLDMRLDWEICIQAK